MLRSPRAWLWVAGGWLILGGLSHLTWHVWGLVLENETAAGLREFAMNAMKQAQSPDPLRPSMWSSYRLFSVSTGMLWILGGLLDVVFVTVDAPRRILGVLALVQTVFWTVAFAAYAFLDPLIQPLLVVAGAVPLHGIAYMVIASPAGEAEGGE